MDQNSTWHSSVLNLVVQLLAMTRTSSHTRACDSIGGPHHPSMQIFRSLIVNFELLQKEKSCNNQNIKRTLKSLGPDCVLRFTSKSSIEDSVDEVIETLLIFHFTCRVLNASFSLHCPFLPNCYYNCFTLLGVEQNLTPTFPWMPMASQSLLLKMRGGEGRGH